MSASPGDALGDRPEIARAIRSVQSGADPDAGFCLLYETYFRAVRGLFIRRSFTPADAQELTQETFMKVYRSMGEYEHRGRFGAWLLTVADSVCRKAWRPSERCGRL